VRLSLAHVSRGCDDYFLIRWDSVRTRSDVRVHRQWLLRQHNNAVSRVEKLSRDHDRDEEVKGGEKEGGGGGGGGGYRRRRRKRG